MRYYWKALFLSTAMMLLISVGYRLLFETEEHELFYEAMVFPADQGEEVLEVQCRLSQLGYYHGEVSGIYDVMTSEAVRCFQEDNGIQASGNCNPETLYRLGIPIDPEELVIYEQRRFLAATIDAVCPEAPYLVRVAFAGMLLQRMNSDRFADDMSTVVFTGAEFHAVLSHDYSKEPSALSWRSAADGEQGMSPCPEALYYYNTENKLSDYSGYRVVYKNGKHVFLSDESRDLI